MNIELATTIIDWHYERSARHVDAESIEQALQDLPPGVKVIAIDQDDESKYPETAANLLNVFDDARPCYCVEVKEAHYLLQ